VISPATGGLPPPTRPAWLVVWCGARNGRRSTSPPGHSPRAETRRVTSMRSSGESGGMRSASARASSDLPAPGGPVSRRPCPPAAATSSAVFASSWERIAARASAARSSCAGDRAGGDSGGRDSSDGCRAGGADSRAVSGSDAPARDAFSPRPASTLSRRVADASPCARSKASSTPTRSLAASARAPGRCPASRAVRGGATTPSRPSSRAASAAARPPGTSTRRPSMPSSPTKTRFAVQAGSRCPQAVAAAIASARSSCSPRLRRPAGCRLRTRRPAGSPMPADSSAHRMRPRLSRRTGSGRPVRTTSVRARSAVSLSLRVKRASTTTGSARAPTRQTPWMRAMVTPAGRCGRSLGYRFARAFRARVVRSAPGPPEPPRAPARPLGDARRGRP